MNSGQAEVLVVGAGPVGLTTAVLLAEAGVEAVLIDREERTAARSYACALHPRSLKLLQRLGLLEQALALGRKVETVSFYQGESRQAELKLSKLGAEFGYLLILPQNALEGLLEQRLKKLGWHVQWRCRFDALQQEEARVGVTVEELAGTSTGYIVPHWETVVKSRTSLQVQFLVGADGHASLVRQRLGLEFQHAGPTEYFAAYEFETSERCADEVRVVLDETTTNVLWPVAENKYRWSFQLLKGESAFPEKERRALRLDDPTIDEQIRQYIHRVARQRAPWFKAAVTRITWCSDVAFERRMTTRFGRHRCWLAGDAAHQTGPVGVQSMNAGLAEAELVAAALSQALRRPTGFELLDHYDQDMRREWQTLLGLQGGLKPRPHTPSWLSARAQALLPCLPGIGADLGALAAQLGFDLP
jgi:2-polyprenyl-6-methoxyphenol hydroxylase-like FAD-dependent oxidoreductase